MFKSLYILLFFALTVAFGAYSQDSTNVPSGQNYFLSFVKKVYLNPTILLKTQDFRSAHNVRVMVLPDMNGQTTNTITGFERAMQKIIRFLIEGDDEGTVRLYFDINDANSPFTVVYSEELYCKFENPAKDSIEARLNAPFSGKTFTINSASLFEKAIGDGLEYIGQCLVATPSECGEQPDFQTTQINTKPLSIALYNTTGSSYDIDRKQYALLESYYPKAKDLNTQMDWYAPVKFMAAGIAEPVAIVVTPNQTGYRKQNLSFRIASSGDVIPIAQSGPQDTVKLTLPSTLPPGQPVEIVASYKSTIDSVNYTVGFFMVYIYQPKTIELNLVSVNGYTINQSEIESQLKKVYDPVGVKFIVSKTTMLRESDWVTAVTIENSAMFSNYPSDLKDYVGGVKDLDDYDSDEYYLVYGLTTNASSSVTGYMPRARNIGFIFNSGVAAAKTSAHEVGHGVFHLRHIFTEEELGASSLGTTTNVMDYAPNPPDPSLIQKELYLHQWLGIDDPAFVSWMSGDDEEGAEIAGLGRVVGCLPDAIKPAINYSKYLPYKYKNSQTYYIKLAPNQKIKTLYYTYDRAYIRSIEEIDSTTNQNKIYVDADDGAIVITGNGSIQQTNPGRIRFININDPGDERSFDTLRTVPVNQKTDFVASIESGGALGFINPITNSKVVFTCSDSTTQHIVTQCVSNYLYSNSTSATNAGSSPLTTVTAHLTSAIAQNQAVDGSNNFVNVELYRNNYILTNWDAGSASPTELFSTGSGNKDLEGINNKLTYLEAATGYKLFVQFIEMGCDNYYSELELFANNVFTSATGDKSKVIYLFVVKNKNDTKYVTYSLFGSGIKPIDVSIIKNYIGNYEQDKGGLKRADFRDYLNALYERIPKKRLVYRVFIEKGNDGEYASYKYKLENYQTTSAYTKRLFKTFKVFENQPGKVIDLEYYLVSEAFSKVEKITSYRAELKEQFIDEYAEDLTLNMISNAPNKFNWGMKSVIAASSNAHEATGPTVFDNTPGIRSCKFDFEKNCTIESWNTVFTIASFGAIALSLEAGLIYEAGLLATRGVYAIMTDQPDQLEEAVLQFGFAAGTITLIKVVGPVFKSAANLVLLKCPRPVKNYIAAITFRNAVSQTEKATINSILTANSPVYTTFFSRTPSNSVCIIRGSNGELIVGRLTKHTEEVNQVIVTTDAVEILGRSENAVLDVENATANQIDNLVADIENSVDNVLTASSRLDNILAKTEFSAPTTGLFSRLPRNTLNQQSRYGSIQAFRDEFIRLHGLNNTGIKSLDDVLNDFDNLITNHHSAPEVERYVDELMQSASKFKGGAFGLEVLANPPPVLAGKTLTGFEASIDDLAEGTEGCRFDMRFSDGEELIYLETKNYSQTTTFSPSFYNQFKSYLSQASSMDEIKYFFRSNTGINEAERITKFKNMINNGTRADELFSIMPTRLKQQLGLGGMNGRSDFGLMINDESSAFYNFIVVF